MQCHKFLREAAEASKIIKDSLIFNKLSYLHVLSRDIITKLLLLNYIHLFLYFRFTYYYFRSNYYFFRYRSGALSAPRPQIHAAPAAKSPDPQPMQRGAGRPLQIGANSNRSLHRTAT